MKLIVTGATGYVGTETVRQALKDPRFTSVIALARKEVPAPTDLGPQGDASKLKSVVISDYGHYSDDVKSQLSGADAVIWTVAITPMKSKTYAWDEVVKVCKTVAVTGFETILAARGSEHGDKPLRFVYMSGVAGERDQSKRSMFMPEMSWLRGSAETACLEVAAKSEGKAEACAAKPGIIYTDTNMLASLLAKMPAPIPSISVAEVAAAMLDQVVNGFEKEPLMSDDLSRIGAAALKVRAEKK